MTNDFVDIESFIFKISKEQADEILEKENHELKRIGLLCECGAFVPDTAEIVIEYDIDGSYYVASIDNLTRGSDRVFCCLKHDVNEVIDNIPCFGDVFKVVKL